MNDQHLITTPIVDAARAYLSQHVHPLGVRQARATEPHLYFSVTEIAGAGFGGIEGVSSEMSDAMYRTVWEAVLFALEAYRIAHYRLWRETEMRTMLSRLDPALARREARRRGEGGTGTQPANS
ncbi:MAG TPA: hypothetical protein VGN72_09565 [Tepidisphaeraceae bacterium]|jgi:hypothetical protein|nr:hypothetical protein [Tepidisphaeraceae bacterium]